MSKWKTIYGFRVKVGSTLWKWLTYNRMRLRGIVPGRPRRNKVVAWAEWAAAQPGAATSYLYGGTPGIGAGTHTDCSGFVLAVYRKVKIELPRTSQQQYADAKHHPDRWHVQNADLLFFNYEGPHSHVGILVGHSVMIADQHTGSGIVRVPVDWQHFDGAGSYLP